ncbi:MAG: hypothetical protein H6964_07850 [Chromatiaceae bacterium]|nr:hypothetical protein [Gammaproteobacteria bacterium]MCB1881662.1 hypothetical protein [Gammaproteobacteria bacterium]MCB1905545.1 hypothetical protein [Gammaproteobacteria bacterium]MCP5427096.1 hypothetical protein [Chromatiaceae bacterium]MCP5446891.1 hypothetical protein [Chromatiaceae bacterium]
MRLPFSQLPGRYERHLLRKWDNPLFPQSERTISAESLEEAQRLDHEELSEFIVDFRKLIFAAVNLQPHADSDTVLRIKERLDKSYEQSAGLADDQRETREAIARLTQIIMAAVRKGAGDDPVALNELAQEEAARSAHFELLAYPLVADLLAPDSPISADDLAPTLLSAPEAEFKAAVTLFDDDQLVLLHRDVQALLETIEDATEDAWRRLALLKPETLS